VTTADSTSEKLIDGEYYQGSYGPTIILNASSLAAVGWIHRLFADLASDRAEIVDLMAMSEVMIRGTRRLLLIQVSEQPEVALRLRSDEAFDGVEFEWRQDAENWRRTAALLEPFLAGDTGHQYLTQENKDEALVELSFGESTHS
jgi:hypothetical protein